VSDGFTRPRSNMSVWLDISDGGQICPTWTWSKYLEPDGESDMSKDKTMP
jgi:hypothetical protein